MRVGGPPIVKVRSGAFFTFSDISDHLGGGCRSKHIRELQVQLGVRRHKAIGDLGAPALVVDAKGALKILQEWYRRRGERLLKSSRHGK